MKQLIPAMVNPAIVNQGTVATRLTLEAVKVVAVFPILLIEIYQAHVTRLFSRWLSR